MKVAHLILTHKEPDQVRRLVEALQHPCFDIYIHVDKKANEILFRSQLQKLNVFFIAKRVSVHWGDWGTIQATINGFKEIIPKGYDYINVISGQDFPIKPADFIYQYLLESKGTEYITCESIKDKWKEAATRLTHYHLINWRFKGRHRLEKVLTYILPQRKFPLDFEIVGRANWFTLTTEAITYSMNFLKRNPDYVRYFKFCWGADEFIFSTILFNSPFKGNIKENLMCVDWDINHRGHPKVYTISDFEYLKESPKLFARKFDHQIDAAVIDKLENQIHQMHSIL